MVAIADCMAPVESSIPKPVSYTGTGLGIADCMALVESRIPKPVSYTSSVPGSLPSHLAFGRRNHRVTLPKRCNPFIGQSDFRLVVNTISGLFDFEAQFFSTLY